MRIEERLREKRLGGSLELGACELGLVVGYGGAWALLLLGANVGRSELGHGE